MDYIYLDELYPNQNLEYGSATLGIPANEDFWIKLVIFLIVLLINLNLLMKNMKTNLKICRKKNLRKELKILI